MSDDDPLAPFRGKQEPEQPEAAGGNCYELYLLLQRLKSGGMSFEQFLAQAKACANQQLAKATTQEAQQPEMYRSVEQDIEPERKRLY